mgnify:CR=1 FL=1
MINGMNLAEQYYEEFGRAALDKVLSDFPGVKIAAGLVGEGSQCFGFDDEISRDHDFAPGFCIWVSDEDFAAAGSALQKAYDSLPPSYKGISRSNIIADDRLGVMTTGGFYSRFTGCEGAAADARSENSGNTKKHTSEDADSADGTAGRITNSFTKLPGLPKSNLDWFLIPETALAAATNGKIFRDDSGVFSEVRRRLLAFYPEDILRKKIAARAAVMSQAGQYNLLRIIKRGDTVAASLAAARFTEAALSMIYLLNRKFMPFYKWAYRGAAVLPLLSDSVSVLGALPGALTFLSSGSLKKAEHMAFEITESICAETAEELRKQGFSKSGSNFLQDHLPDIMSGIQDPRFRNMPPMADCNQ